MFLIIAQLPVIIFLPQFEHPNVAGDVDRCTDKAHHRTADQILSDILGERSQGKGNAEKDERQSQLHLSIESIKTPNTC